MYIDWLLNIPTISEANVQSHWAVKAKRQKLQKRIINEQFELYDPVITLPCTVTLTRIGLREIDDDNLAYAFKTIRDAIADNLVKDKAPGQADSDKRITWLYKQESGKVRRIRVQIS